MTAHVPTRKLKVLPSEVPRAFAPLLVPRRFRGMKGGRGSGKSHFAAEDAVLDMLATHVRLACIREIQKSIKDSVKQLIEDKIALLGHRYSGAVFDEKNPSLIVTPGDPKEFRRYMAQWAITDREISYRPTQSLIIFRGLQNHTAASIKSLEGFNRAWCEEAQTLTQRSLDLAIPTFRSGSQLTFTWNPVSPKDPVDKLFRENKDDPDFCLVHANYSENPWFPAELRRDMERDRRRDPDKYKHVWLGQYQTASQARVFHNYTVEEFDTPADARFYFGADWGFAVDPTVLIRCFIKGDKLYIDQEAYEVGCEIDNTPALFAGVDDRTPARWQNSNPTKWKGIPGATKWPMTADSARPETISYMQRRGFRIKPSIKGKGSVEDGIEFLKSFDIVVHPRCVHTVDELATYSYEIDKKTGEILPVLEDRKNHVIDALRYALETTRRSNYTLANI